MRSQNFRKYVSLILDDKIIESREFIILYIMTQFYLYLQSDVFQYQTAFLG